MRPLRIAHISDLHLSAEHRRVNIRNTTRVLDYIAQQHVDHVVITGDITADGKRGDYELARQLFASYGLLDSAKLSLVIGNHDIYGGVNHAEEILDFPRRCKQTDYNAKVKEFRHWFPEVFERCMFAGHGAVFPYAKVVGDVLFVGMNSNARYSRVKNLLGSNGKVCDEEYQRVKGILSADLFKHKRRIVLIHHHFNKMETQHTGAMHSVWSAIERETMKLRGKKALFKLFREQRVELILHGHHHESRAYERKGVRFMNAGGSVAGLLPNAPSVNIISVADERMETEVHTLPADHSAISGPRIPALLNQPTDHSISTAA